MSKVEYKSNKSENRKQNIVKDMDCDNDWISFPVYQHKFFYANGTIGQHAETLYLHLLFTSKMQYGNPRVSANNYYLKNGLNWGDLKLKRAKKFLIESGIIEYSQENDSGCFGKSFIDIKKIWNIDDIESQSYGITGNKSNITDPKTTLVNPLVQISDYRINHVTGISKQTNKERKKETYKKEEGKEERKEIEVKENISPSPLSFNNLNNSNSFIRELERIVDVNKGGTFFFTQETKLTIDETVKVMGDDWTREIFTKYVFKKTASQIRNFCRKDLPEYFDRSMRNEKKKNDSSVTNFKIKVCPVCNREQPLGGTIIECGHCGLPYKYFNNQSEILEYKNAFSSRDNITFDFKNIYPKE